MHATVDYVRVFPPPGASGGAGAHGEAAAGGERRPFVTLEVLVRSMMGWRGGPRQGSLPVASVALHSTHAPPPPLQTRKGDRTNVALALLTEGFAEVSKVRRGGEKGLSKRVPSADPRGA